jgi:hypothetical protein
MTFTPLVAISHLPVLDYVLRTLPVKKVLEFGVGHGSTKLFLAHECQVTSVETDKAWADKFKHHVIVSDNYLISGRYDLVLIDNHPSNKRIEYLEQAFNFTNLVIAHDTEPASENEYSYSKVQVPNGWRFLDCQVMPTWTTIFTDKLEWLPILQQMPTFTEQDVQDLFINSWRK